MPRERFSVAICPCSDCLNVRACPADLRGSKKKDARDMARYKEQLDSKVQESSLQLPGPCDLAPDFASDCAK